MTQEIGCVFTFGAKILAYGVFAITGLFGKPSSVASNARQSPLQMLKGNHPQTIIKVPYSKNKNLIDNI